MEADGSGEVEPILLLQVGPVRLTSLTSTLQDPTPSTQRRRVNGGELWPTMRKRKVGVEALQHGRQLVTLVAHLPMHVLPEPFANTVEKSTKSLLRRQTHNGKLALSVHATYVAETQKGEFARFLSVFCEALPSEPTENQSVSFLG